MKLLRSFCLALACFAAGSASAQSTWTLRNQDSNPPQQGYLWGLAEGNAGVVAVGENGRILHSVDGRTWTRRTSGTTNWLVAITFGNGSYVAVGDNGTILTSTNAIVWTPVASAGTTARLNNVLFAQGKFVAVGEGGAIVVSTDGTTWNPVTSNAGTAWLRGLAYGGNSWIATGQSGTITTSFDGIVWTKRAVPGQADLEAVTFAESSSYTNSNNTSGYSYFLTVGSSGTVQSVYAYSVVYPSNPSSNFQSFATNFSNRLSTTARFRSVSKANGAYVITGENGEIYTAKSQYGPWTKAPIATTKNLVGAGSALGSLVLIGENETIFQSEQIFLSKLGNISTRGAATSGAGAMIAGTVVRGTRPKQFLVRGIGPALGAFGVTGFLADPVLSIFNGTGQLVTSNTGWGTNLNTAAIVTAARDFGAFALTANSRDSALLVTLNPGTYTFQLTSASGATGNALVEAYDLDVIDATSSRAINISTRGQVGTGENILIAGLVVQGQASRTLLIRGVGPTLTQFGVTGTLADPVIKVIDSSGATIATNDNWGDTTLANGRAVTADEVELAAGASGAFALAASSKDAALLITLVPGSYTIQVSGTNNTTGLALVEAYDVPNN